MENIKNFGSPDLQVVMNKFSPFLNEVKKRLFFTASVFAIGTVIGFVYVQNIIKFLLDILSLKGINIIFTSPFQFINLSISCGVAVGLITAFPLIVTQLMSFLKPALRPGEYKMILGFLPFSIVLFIVGFASGILMMKWQIEIFLGQTVTLGVGNMLDVTHLLSIVIITSALMGAAFQCPIVLLVLMRIGLVKHSQLTKVRPLVYLGSFVFAVLLPPDSVLFDVLATLPLVILFELTLILNRFLERKSPGRVVLEGA